MLKLIRNVMVITVLLLAAAAVKQQPVQASSQCEFFEWQCEEQESGAYIEGYLGACDGSGWIRAWCCIGAYCSPPSLCCTNESGCSEPPPGCVACSPSGC